MAAFLAAFAVATPSALALVAGTQPTAFRNYRVFGDSLSVGNTLMSNLPTQPLVNSILLSSSSARVRNVPRGASVEGAFLFWSGTTDPSAGVDRTVQFTLANGTTTTLRADNCYEVTGPSSPGVGSLNYFYCRADVTSLVAANPVSGTYNGLYAVGGMQALAGTLDAGGQCINPLCQGMYGGWSMVMVWEAETETTLRDVAVFDGFRLLDETRTTAAVDRFTIGGLDVADPPEATLRFFALEGDALLGVPPQDSDPVLRCTTCFDYMAANGIKLSDSLNPTNNLFNSTLPEGSAIGVDIDSFDVSGVVRPGDTTVAIEVGSGDGDPRTGQENGAGGGELFVLGYTVLTINRLAPNFRTVRTLITADPTEGAPGDTVFYTVVVTNDGSLDATNVRVQVPLPPNTEYIAGSTRQDDAPLSDLAGGSPLFSGLTLGRVPPAGAGDNDRRITFRVRILPDTPNGTVIPATATITANELPDPTVVGPANVRVIAPTLLTPQKTAQDLNGGALEPGDFVTYTVRIRKDAGTSAAALTFVDDISPYAALQTVNASGFTDESTLTGGANASGQVRITEITIPVGTTAATISFTVRIRSVEELLAAGVDAADIDGLLIRNQGSLNAAFLPSALLTDNPATSASPDPTDLRLTSSVNFRNASTFKTAEDVDGEPLAPGDTVRFTISVRNSGSQSAQVDLNDDLPAGLTGARLVAPVAGVTFSPAPAGANRTGRVSATGLTVGARATVSIVVEARVAPDAAGGTLIRNIARLDVPSFPDQSQDLTAPDLVVTAGPRFDGATKTASGAVGGFSPGDAVTWTVRFTNEGTSDATGVRVTDVVDSRLTSITPQDGGTYNAAARTISWAVGRVAVGETRQVTFTARIAVTVPDGAVIPNQASIVLPDGASYVTDDPATPAVDDPTLIRVQAVPEIVVEKAVADLNRGAFEPSDAIRYTIVVRNNGRAPATNVSVVDPLPSASLAGIRVNNGGTFVDGTARWTPRTTPALASIAAGASVTLTIEATVAPTAGNGDRVANQARVSADGGFDVVSDDTSTSEPNDPTAFVVSAVPSLRAEKTFVDENGGTQQPGDEVTWTIRVVNSGRGPARDVVVSDVVDAALTDVSPEDGGAFEPGSRTITWTPPGEIAAGGELLLRFRSTVATGTPNGTRVRNQARVEAADVAAAVLSDDPATPTANDPTSFVVVSQADFASSTKEVTLAGGGTEFRPGSAIVYRIVVRNSGTGDATGARVVDPVPANLVDVRAGSGGTVSGGQVVWSLGNVAAGTTVELTVEATVAFPLDDGTVIANQATISSAGVPDAVTDDPATPVADDPTAFTVSSRADLSESTKAFTDANGAPVRPGDRIDYVIVVTNTGSADATDVTVVDPIDANLTDIAADGGRFDAATRTLTFSPATSPGLARIPAGGAVELRVSATVAAALENGTVVANQAEVRAGADRFLTDDPTTSSVDDPTQFQVISSFDLSNAAKVVDAAPPGGFRPGAQVTYRIRFSNTGDAPARNVVVTDTLPPNLVFVSASGGGALSGGAVRWTARANPALATLAVGQTVELEVRALVASPLANGTVIDNQAQLTADGGAAPFLTDDPTTPAVDDATRITVSAAAALSTSTKVVTDVDGDGLFEPGNGILYTITVINTGDAPATDVVVRDPVPAGLRNVAALDGGTVDAGAVVWTSARTPGLASVAPGDAGAVVLRFRAALPRNAVDGTVVSNQALVSSGALVDVPTDDPANGIGDADPTTFTVVAQARLENVVKTVVDENGGAVLGGDTLEYTIAFENGGTQAATNVVVRDPIPGTLTNVVPRDAGAIDGDSVVWNVGNVDVGGRRTLRFRATVRAGTGDGTAIANQAFAQADGVEPVPSDDPTTEEPGDPTVVVVNALPDLRIEKRWIDLNEGTPAPGDSIRYEITVRNEGTGAAVGLDVVDLIDGANLVDVRADNGGSVAPDGVRWDLTTTPELASLPPGGIVVLNLDARIADVALNGTLVANQADLGVSDGERLLSDDPSTPEAGDATTFTVSFAELAQATLEVTDLNGGRVEAGDRLQYVIVIAAGGGVPLTNVAVDVPIDVALIDVVGGTFDAAAGILVIDAASEPALANLPPGAVVRVVFEATIAPETPIGTTVATQGFVRSDESPGSVPTDNPATPEVADATVVVTEGDSSTQLERVTKTVEDLNGDLLLPGDVLRYTIDVLNGVGGTTTGLTVVDTLPTRTTYVEDSLVVNGVAVPGAYPLGAGLAVPDLGPAEVLSLSFDVRVEETAPVGVVIANQATVADAAGVLVVSDDPGTPEVGDATNVVVGGAPELTATRKLVTPGDENGDGIAQTGETLRYTIVVPNRGTTSATNVVVSDPLPANAELVIGSVTVNGVPMTEAPGDDLAEVIDGLLEVFVGEIPAGQTAEIGFAVTAIDGTFVSNQAVVTFDGGAEPSDDDEDGQNGNNPTVTPLDGATLAPEVTKTVSDADGGAVLAGDLLLYTVTVRALSAIDGVVVVDRPDEGVVLEAVLAAPTGVEVTLLPNEGTLAVSALPEGGSATVLIQGRVVPDAADGAVVCNRVEGEGFDLPEPACVTVGGFAGLGALEGTVFRELGEANGAFGDATDEALEGFVVRLRPASGAEIDVTTGADGRFSFEQIGVGDLTLDVYAPPGPTGAGALFASLPIVLAQGESSTRDVLIDPTGVVYDALSRQPLGGMRAWLYEVGASKAVFDPTRAVPAEELPRPSQQGQLVPPNGIYRFDLPPGRSFELFIDTAGQPYVFPSTRIAPAADLVTADERVELVEAALPSGVASGAERYALLVNAEEGAGVFKNHIPVDRVESGVTLTKRVDRVAAVVGDVLTYTLTLRNESGADLLYDALNDIGGVYIEDAIPSAFRYVNVSAVGELRDLATNVRQRVPMGAVGELLMRFGAARQGEFTPLDLPANSELEVRYFLVVGSSASPGERYRNRAYVRSADRTEPLSNVDHVDVRIEYDPVFDQGVLMGRAFCDADGDGRVSRGERGLPSARIFLDSGYYTDTDVDGRYHFSDIDPGLHLVKVDARTLPPGSSIVSDEARAFNVTNGMPSLVDFAVRCNDNFVTDIEVLPGDGALADAARLRRERYVEVAGTTWPASLQVDGVDVPLVSAALAVGVGEAPVEAAPAAAPAPAAFAEPDASGATPAEQPNSVFRPVTEALAAAAATEAPAPAAPAIPPAPPTAADSVDATTAAEAEAAVETPALPRPTRPVVTARIADEALVENLWFAPEVPVESSRWVVEVADATSGVVVFQRSGTGAAAPFAWDGTDAEGYLVLASEAVYEVRLRVLFGLSRFAAAAPTLLVIQGTRDRFLAEETRSGDSFDGAQPNAELRAMLDGMRDTLAQTAPARVRVEAHLDDRDNDEDATGTTQRQAEAVAAYLARELGVDAERIDVRGRGTRAPIYPNIGDRTRATNRRIEVRVVAPEPEILTPPLPTLDPLVPGVRAGQREIPASADGVFRDEIPKPPDGLLVLTHVDATGAARGSVVAIREGATSTRAIAELPRVPVVVDLEAGRVSVGQADVELAGAALRLGVETPYAVLNGRVLDPAMRFPFSNMPEGVASWTFTIRDVAGAMVFEERGEGQPPGGRPWAGRTSDGVPLTEGEYEARVTVRLTAGGMAESPALRFAVVEGELPETPPAISMAETVPRLVRVNGVRVEGTGGRYETTVETMTGRTLLVDVTVNGGRVIQPVTVPDGFAPRLSAPVDVQPYSILVAPTPPADAAAAETTSAEEGGRRGRGRGAAAQAQPAAPVAPSAPPAAEPAPEEPAPAPFAPLPPPAEPEAPSTSPFAPVTGRWLLTRPSSMPSLMQGQAVNPFAPVGGAPAAAVEAPAPAPSAETDAPAAARGSASTAAETPSVAAPAATPFVEAPAAGSPAGVAPSAAPAVPSAYDDIASFYAEELEAALAGDDMDAMLAALAASEAGVISVQLPPAGVPLRSNRLPVYGTTLPTNEVYVGGNRVDVEADGRFHTVVELPGGSSVLLVETRDREGNRGQLEWPVEVSNSSFFLMAIADTALGNRHADIAGMNEDNHITTDSGVTAYGQARLYFKGWVSGEEVLSGFFEDVEITAHLDTAKRREYESFVREVIEPERSYPVYGDASQQVSDVNARGKVYVLLQAGDSSATWGNFNTEIRGVELLAYERNLHGARVVFDETIADEFHTEVQAHVADEEADRVQTYNYLRGTGGSIYYLQNRQVVEGTERVAVVIRDSVSGVELARMPLTRNSDYTFRYSEGRIVLKSPLPSVVDDGLLLGNYTSTRSTLRGHAVYLEVAYDHLGGHNDSEMSYGVHVRETLYDWVSVGGGAVRESRGDAQGYSLWGVEAGVGPTETTRVDVEYARSESQDLGYAYSDDGGLTFDRFREDVSLDTPAEGDAMLVRAQFELADVLTTERDHIWSVDGRYQRADRGFYANGRILDQGEERYSLASQLRMHDHHAMQLRLDRVNTVVDDLQSTGLGDLVETRRQVAVAEYLYNDHPAELRLAYQHTYGDDARLPDSYANDILGVSIGVHVLRWLRLGAGQEIVVNGDDPNVIRGAGGDTDTRFEDRFITSVSTGIRVTDAVEIEASERFRYSGENSAMVGVNVRTDDDTRVYAQQRFDSPRDNSGGAMNTVVGGEQRYGRDASGRAYGEYQTQSGVSGERSRALLGFGKRWQIVDGFSIDAGYEHSNTLSALSVESENSRDTLSLGWEWSQLDALKLTGLLEGRFEQGSVHSPAAATCLAGAISGNPAYCRDEVRSVGDRRQLVSMTSAQAQATRDLTLFGRFDIVATENTTLRLLESRDVEGTIAAAYRPIDHNWVNLLLRYTYLSEMAPYQLELNQRRDEWSHVFSLSPVVELPLNFQLAEKLAYRQLHLRVEGMPDVRNDIVLWANRINYHLFRQWDVGVEYRFLHQSLTGDWRHGTLVEANYIVADHVRLGLGYNFTRFAEDELGDFDSDRHGFYFRVTAQY